MKKLLLLFVLIAGFGLSGAYAQHCGGKMKAAATTVAPADRATAVQAALQDESIEMRENEQTGEVVFLRKSVCQTSGKVSYAKVQYDGESAAFVSAAPQSCAKSGKAVKTAAANEAAAPASCCAGGDKAKATAESKGCCSSAQKAACSKAKAKTATDQDDTKKVKLVKSGM